jgi:hypothetical protein
MRIPLIWANAGSGIGGASWVMAFPAILLAITLQADVAPGKAAIRTVKDLPLRKTSVKARP